MATTYYTDIQKLYVAYFNRPADPAGLAAWESAMESAGADTAAQAKILAAISADFAASNEYKTAYANMTNTQVVDQVYKNLFGHGAVGVDDAGLKYWVDLLDKKALTIDNVVAGIAGGALGTDKVAYDSKVTFASTFTAAVDTDAEKAGYSGDVANAAAKKVMAGITDAATLAAASAPGTLNASVSAVVAAGTPFSVTSALASYQATTKAMTTFLDAADGKADGTVTGGDAAVKAAIAADVTDAVAALDAAVAGDYTGGSTAVKAALLSDQVSANAKALADANADIADANTAIAKVSGLTGAEATLASAVSAAKTADKAVTTAAADLAAKVASYNVIHSSAPLATPAGDGTITGVIVLNSSNKLVLATGVTETNHAGITDVLNSSIAKEAADAAATKAHNVQTAAQDQVNYLDMSADEKAALTAIKADMVDVKVADGALPTLAQIATQKAIFDANGSADNTKAGAFATDLATYNTAVAAADANPLTKALNDATDAASTAQDNIDTLTDLVSDLTDAQSAATQLDALQKSIDAAIKVFTDHDLIAPVTITADALATAGSDIFVAGSTNASISLFGLLGNDSLYVGSDYTLNTGKLSAGSDNALEVFVSQSGSDTKLVIEKHVFSSHVTGAVAPELVTITLVGVDASTVHLTNGIITAGNPTA